MKRHEVEERERTVARALADLRASTVTIAEAAELLGKSAPAVRVAVARGRIPAIHIGRAVLIPRASVDRLCDPAGAAPIAGTLLYEDA